ncbi:sigma-70 family RNA polymerase sigma factor [Microbacterium sp. NC79]|uniref:RNA polymerase sigma factor n=1 Tax=Microbacterium sp. NC79 TaxID=2851009 RepID=UPI001C2C5F69|nr:sigma-70 family RNA polymerase sigma factor [Microbacterium sp. NC79]
MSTQSILPEDGLPLDDVRRGDSDEYATLWSRHYRAGVSAARALTSSIDPDDLVQEAFTRAYQALLSGGGPRGAFRPYLFTSIRNTAASWDRARAEVPLDGLDMYIDPESSAAEMDAGVDRVLVFSAFRRLPARWQEVLWYTEIDQLKPAQVGPRLGMKPAAAAQLALRAREGLREAWVAAHLNA